MSMSEKPVYETPKVTSLDNRNSVLGGENGNDKCDSGSGDVFGCLTGNTATGWGCDEGNSPATNQVP